MPVIGDEPLASDAQDVVVIVEPTSRHGARGDRVTIITSVLVNDEIIELAERREIQEEDGAFSLQLIVPVRGTEFNGPASWSVVVLLPRKTGDYDIEVEAGGDVTPQTFTPDAENPRRAVFWHSDGDPALDVLWRYLNLK